MIDPATVALFIPAGLKKFKLDLFERIGSKIEAHGGRVVRGDYAALDKLPDEIIPIIGCTPPFRPMIMRWTLRGRTWAGWDRGYLRRVFATWLPTGSQLGVPGGYYRWHINGYQMKAIRDVPDDRWLQLKLDDQVKPWRKSGDRIVIADTGHDYWDLHADRDWSARTARELRHHTDRPIVIRDKESKVPLYKELADAHCLVTHGSIAAVESVVMGCPVFVDKSSAAALVGETDFAKIETPAYPGRMPWIHSLCYSQFNETELVDGTLFRLIT